MACESSTSGGQAASGTQACALAAADPRAVGVSQSLTTTSVTSSCRRAKHLWARQPQQCRGSWPRPQGDAVRCFEPAGCPGRNSWSRTQGRKTAGTFTGGQGTSPRAPVHTCAVKGESQPPRHQGLKSRQQGQRRASEGPAKPAPCGRRGGPPAHSLAAGSLTVWIPGRSPDGR